MTRIEDDKVIDFVDSAWNPMWCQTPLIRPFKLAGDVLVMSGALRRDL